MKIPFRLILVATLALAACRKEKPQDLPDGYVEVLPHCQNGVMDGDEDGVDCGTGSCEPCLLSHPTCSSGESFTDNAGEASGTDFSFTAGQVTSSSTSGRLVIEASNGTAIVRVTFPSANPDVFQEYVCYDYPYPATGKAYVEYLTGPYHWRAYYGEVHLNREGGKYTVEMCGVYMGDPNVGDHIIMKTRLISSN